jgi:hypothetical protein
MDLETIIAKLLNTISLVLLLVICAGVAGYVVGSIKPREPTMQEKVKGYLQKHYHTNYDKLSR